MEISRNTVKAADGYLGNTSLNTQRYSPQMAKRKLTSDEEAAVAAGESRWMPTLFQNYGTPVTDMMASPLKMSLLTGIPVAAIVAALASNGKMTQTAAGQPLLTGLAAGVGGGLGTYWHQQSRNKGLKDMMTRLPEHATKRDLMADSAYQADLDRSNALTAARFLKMHANAQEQKSAAYAFGKLAAGISPATMKAMTNAAKPVLNQAGAAVKSFFRTPSQAGRQAMAQARPQLKIQPSATYPYTDIRINAEAAKGMAWNPNQKTRALGWAASGLPGKPTHYSTGPAIVPRRDALQAVGANAANAQARNQILAGGALAGGYGLSQANRPAPVIEPRAPAENSVAPSAAPVNMLHRAQRLSPAQQRALQQILGGNR